MMMCDETDLPLYLSDEAVDDELDVRVQVLPRGLGRGAHHLDALLHHVVAVLVLDTLHHLRYHMT